MYVDRLICIMFVSHQEYKMSKGTVNLGFLQGIVDNDPKNIGQNGKDTVVFTLKTYASFGDKGEDKAMRHEIHITDQNNCRYALQFIRKNNINQFSKLHGFDSYLYKYKINCFC